MNSIKTIIINELKVISNITEYSYDIISYTFDHIRENNYEAKNSLIKIFKHPKRDSIIKESILYCYNDYNKLFENTYLHTDDLFVFTDMVKNIISNISEKYKITKKHILVLVEILFKCLFYAMEEKTSNSFIFHNLLNSAVKSCEFEFSIIYNYNNNNCFSCCC